MPVDDSLLELMTMEFEWRARDGVDAWNRPSFAEPVTIVGYLQEEEHQVTDANGTKRVAKGTLWLADVYGLGTEDEVDWDGERLGDLIKIVNFYDDAGPYGSEVHYG